MKRDRTFEVRVIAVLEILYRYLWYFLIFGFLGWLSEVIYAACIEKKFVNRGFLNSPFCPIYGFGVVIVSFCLAPVRDNVILLFLGAVVLTSLLELATGFVLEKTFHTKWWDYSENKFNFFGYICLGFSLLWGVACTFVERFVLPVIDTVVQQIPPVVSVTVFFVVAGVLVVDFAITVGAIAGLNKQVRALADLTERIKNIAEKLEKEAEGTAKNQLLLLRSELAVKYDASLQKTGIIKRRMIKAFPDLKKKKYHKEVTDLQLAMEKFAEDAKVFAEDMEVKRQKMVLETYEDHLPKNAEHPFGYGLCFNKLFVLFMIGNVFGCVLEIIWAFVTLHKFEMRVGLVYGPFIPVYGFGAVLITLCLYKFYKTRDLWLFFGSMIIGASFEYFASYFQEMLLGTVSWDYTGTLLNIDGRTNLMYGLIWGVLGLVWVKDIYPFISKQIERIPKKVGNIAVIALVIFMVFDAGMSIFAIMRQNQRNDGIPAKNEFEVYLDEKFNDDYLAFIYPHMQDAKTGVENSEKTPD